MVLCAILLIVVAGISYAFSTLYLEGTRRQVIRAGTLSLELDEDENNLTIENAMPMYDEVGMIQQPFTFRLINDNPVSVDYTLKLEQINTTNLSPTYIKYGLEKDGKPTIDFVSNIIDNVVDTGRIEANTTIEYTLRLWIDWNVEDETLVSGKALSYRIDIEVEQINKDYYEFAFHPNGGAGENTTIVCVHEEECDLTKIPFTKENHTLVGWSTSIDGDLVYKADFTLEEIGLNPGATVNLYAVWGINYVYNYGNQYTADTGGWTYTRTWFGDGNFLAYETFSFATSYMQWSELGTVLQYGGGYIEHGNLVSMSNAKTINLVYTAPTVTTQTVSSGTYYPQSTFYILNSSGEIIVAKNVSFSSVQTALQTLSLDVSSYDLTSARIRILYTTTNSGGITFVHRTYSVYATY